MHNKVYTVSELTKNIKGLLEENFPIIWISGEISNFSTPLSGHHYFSLKDDFAQISSVMFKGQNRKLKFVPENGMEITGLGRVSVYEPRGSYQLILEHLEPKGIGSLQIAFEQLKEKLYKEGLFDEQYKKQIPFLPKKISIITSPTGAVVHDIIKVINRRFPKIHIEVVPVKVQGQGADQEIVNGINKVNKIANADVIIIARGGGSLEDLYSFNMENVVRAIFESEIPVISAVGHETDYTISDFVSDLRAPTPSVAAELAVPVKEDLERTIEYLSSQLKFRFTSYLKHYRTIVIATSKRLINPRKKIEDLRLRIDDYSLRLMRVISQFTSQRREKLTWQNDKLFTNNPMVLANNLKGKIKQNNDTLLSNMKLLVKEKDGIYKELNARLSALNPKSILDRGYSITRTVPEANIKAKIIRSSDQVNIDQDLEVLFSKGSIICKVKRKR